ncbi:DMT family transporter [Pseudonocardia endophytica]|uniref:Threonine/homoserine efflux transporter RhtA n=1 Tax=Pseudonocardia endophytica TaxID=401976 RepID=A0A4R1HUW6_PSEEN|nr:DMT family transporter [Pseudonocardia endophytica]TCK24460.1 threonine/homoserine efflux transporter RhtA [Pseudonocardia endophytica]
MTITATPTAAAVRGPAIAAGVTVLLWASAFVGVRAAGHFYDAGTLALGRQVAASVALTIVVGLRAFRQRRAPSIPRGRVLVGVLVWGAAWFGAYNISLNAAETHLDAGTTALLVNVAPVLVAVLAGLLLGEGFPRRLLIGVAVALAGVVVITVATSTGRADATGVLLGLLAAVLYASSATGQKRLLSRVDALTMTWMGCVAGTAATLPWAPSLVTAVATAPSSATLTVLYLGLFPTAVAFLCWGYALSRTSAGRLAATTYAVPAIVVLLSWLLLAEVPVPLALAGGALCVAGVAVATLPTRRRGVRPV